MESLPLNTACKWCRDAFCIANPISEQDHLTVRGLKTSAAKGCLCCQFIATEIGNIEQVPKVWELIGYTSLEEEELDTLHKQSTVLWQPKCNRFIYKVFDYPKRHENFQTEFECYCRTRQYDFDFDDN